MPARPEVSGLWPIWLVPPHGRCTASPAESVQQYLVSLQEPGGSSREVLVLANAGELGDQRLDDEGVDAGAVDPGNRLRLLGELLGEPYGRLLCHDHMISRFHDVTRCFAGPRPDRGTTDLGGIER